jgi:hypothetical protein
VIQIVGLLFCLAGLIMSIEALVSGKISPNIPIAMLFVCVGLMLTSVGNRRK